MEGDQSSLTEYKGGNYRKLTVNLGGSLEYLGGFFFFFWGGGGQVDLIVKFPHSFSGYI